MVSFMRVPFLIAVILFGINTSLAKAQGEVSNNALGMPYTAGVNEESNHRTRTHELSSVVSGGPKPIAAEWKRLREVEFEVNSLAWSPDGTFLAMTGITSPIIHVWDVAQEKVARTLKHSYPGLRFETLAYSPDGRFLASCEGGESVFARIWNPATGDIVKDILRREFGTCSGILFSPNGSLLAISRLAVLSPNNKSVDAVTFFDTTKWNIIGGVKIQNLAAVRIAFSSDQRLLAIGADHFGVPSSGSIMLWDLEKGAVVKSVVAHEKSNTLSLAFSRNGKFVATGTNANQLFGQQRREVSRQSSLAEEAPARIWDLESGKISTLVDHSARQPTDMYALNYSPDGRYLISAGTDSKIRIWDGQTHGILQTLNLLGPATCLAVDSTSTKLAVGTGKLVTIWSLPQ